ncbi:MAG: hypothetical protein ABI467_02040 [Kofleriaceae bacterium]
MAATTNDEYEPPATVAASEAEIVAMARALIAPQALDVWGLLAGSRTLPAKIGPTCAALVGDALAQLWPALWRRDGARPGAALRAGKVVRGRGWERHPVAPLEHSPYTLALVRWLVAMPLAVTGAIDKLGARPATIGDQVIAYLALEISRETPAQLEIARWAQVARAPLAWLGFAHLLPGDPPEPAAFDELVTGPGAVVIEALQLELAKRWRAVELTKRAMTDPDPLIAIGHGQEVTLTRFMDACTRAGRRDLAGFILDAMLPLLARDVAPFPDDLDRTRPLSVRMAARHAAGALLRGLATWCGWDREHRGVRFLDDDYEASQLLLSRFEQVARHGADVLVATWLAQLSSLAPPASSGSATIEAP